MLDPGRREDLTVWLTTPPVAGERVQLSGTSDAETAHEAAKRLAAGETA